MNTRALRVTSGAEQSSHADLALRGPLLVGLVLMVASLLLRLPTAYFTGSADQPSFNSYIVRFAGAYSDIPSLYFRDALWRHPIPYVDYPLEYPVGMGSVIWLLGFVN